MVVVEVYVQVVGDVREQVLYELHVVDVGRLLGEDTARYVDDEDDVVDTDTFRIIALVFVNVFALKRIQRRLHNICSIRTPT